MVAQIWQEIDAQCHICHSWQEWQQRMITAMTTFTAVLLLIMLAAAARLLVGYVRHDGFSRPRLPDLPGSTAGGGRKAFDPWRDPWNPPPRIRLH